MISIYEVEGRYEIGGRTWPYRHILRDWGATWDPALEVWVTTSVVALAQIRASILAQVRPDALAQGAEMRIVRRHELRPSVHSPVLELDGATWQPVAQTVWRDLGRWWGGVDYIRMDPIV